jgi:hypothetical protein
MHRVAFAASTGRDQIAPNSYPDRRGARELDAQRRNWKKPFPTPRCCQRGEPPSSKKTGQLGDVAVFLAASAIALWRLARDHGFRPRAACDGRRREDRKIGVAAREGIEADLLVPYGCKLTAQETWWRTMLGGWFESVDNADARARVERWDEIVEQGVRLYDLVIHVHQDRNVE